MPFITAAPTHFLRDGQPFFALGFNAYYLGFCSESTQKAVLETAQLSRAPVIRAWAFLDSGQPSPIGPAFQHFTPNGAVIHEGASGLARLDALIAHAEAAGIALLLPLTNGWGDFGGMPLYAQCFAGSSRTEDFYSSPAARTAYRNWVEALLTRRNTFTGRFYCDEPSVMAWELANEPRHTGRDGREILLEWVTESAAFIKTLDQNHLLAVGDEGFFHKRGHGHLHSGAYGVDAEAILSLDAIDFGTYHLYPDHWNVPGDFGLCWIREHADLARKVGKPMVLEEFGLSTGAVAKRISYYSEWAAAACANGSAGALFWMLGSMADDVSSYRDAFTLYTCPVFDSDGKSSERLRFA